MSTVAHLTERETERGGGGGVKEQASLVNYVGGWLDPGEVWTPLSHGHWHGGGHIPGRSPAQRARIPTLAGGWLLQHGFHERVYPNPRTNTNPITISEHDQIWVGGGGGAGPLFFPATGGGGGGWGGGWRSTVIRRNGHDWHGGHCQGPPSQSVRPRPGAARHPH